MTIEQECKSLLLPRMACLKLSSRKSKLLHSCFSAKAIE